MPIFYIYFFNSVQ